MCLQRKSSKRARAEEANQLPDKELAEDAHHNPQIPNEEVLILEDQPVFGL
jgi:hypothetical protein